MKFFRNSILSNVRIKIWKVTYLPFLFSLHLMDRSYGFEMKEKIVDLY